MLKLLKSAALIILPFMIGTIIMWSIRGKDIQIVDWLLKQVNEFVEQSFWELLANTFNNFITDWNNIWIDPGNWFNQIINGIRSIGLVLKALIQMIVNIIIWLTATIIHVFEMIGTFI